MRGMSRIDRLSDLLASPRSRSWLYFATAFATPLLAYAVLWALDTGSSDAVGGVRCGLLGLLWLIVSVVVSITLFSAAFFAALLAYLDSSSRSLARAMEFLGIGLPFIAMCAGLIGVVVLKLTI
ncbi:hypothetical protein [Lysobacter sp. Root916]|nr:hypothetical protein [Lysobacter sp. Root916]